MVRWSGVLQGVDSHDKAMNSASVGNDFVILECTDPNCTDPENTGAGEISISTDDISGWDLPAIINHRIVRVKADRNRLIEHSSYFRGLLGGGFRESQMSFVQVRWSIEAFLNILRFMHGCLLRVTSSNCLFLFQAALYFGVEMILLEFTTWLSKDSSQIEMDDAIHIHNFALEHGIEMVRELCIGYIAKNFMLALASGTFVNIPYSLLLSCLEHQHLTVDSERHLAEALLAWVSANLQQPELTTKPEYGCTDILKRVRVCLLPLWFAMGKRKCCYFSGLAERTIDAIFSLLERLSSFPNIAGDDDLSCMRIRLTKYTKKLDLSGCPQINSTILLLSLLPSSNTTDFLLQIQSSLSTLSFGSVEEVDISKCPSLHLRAAIQWLCMSFPSLQILRAAYLLDIEALNLRQLLGMCSSVHEIDLTVDSSPIITSQGSIICNRGFAGQVPRTCWDVTSSFGSHIAKLTLEGRTDINDSDLLDISEFCVSLNYLNIQSCISLTDVGISNFLSKCINLHSLIASYTKFGRRSVLSLCCGIPDARNFSVALLEQKNIGPSLANLQMLHVDGCNGVHEASLVDILSRVHMVKSLCLRDTSLSDKALCSFSGSSLEVLDVSNTLVTEVALCHIVHKNPGLRCLRARGCKNLHQNKNTNNDIGSHSSYPCQELFIELRKTFKLEELTVGWGFSFFSLDALGPAIISLKSLTVGLGGTLGPEGLMLLPSLCPLLESVTLFFQIISDDIVMVLLETLGNLRKFEVCYCMGVISSSILGLSVPNLRILKLERVTPWMTNGDLAILTQSCANLIELSLIGCVCLDADTQLIISQGWPGLICLHLEDCGSITANGFGSLFDCKALEDLLLRHTGRGLKRNFILEAASKLPMLRILSVDSCDAIEDTFRQPNLNNRYSREYLKVARCDVEKPRKRPVHKETSVDVYDTNAIHTTPLSLSFETVRPSSKSSVLLRNRPLLLSHSVRNRKHLFEHLILSSRICLNIGSICSKSSLKMPKVKTSRVKYPEGWELIEPTLRELQAKMREAENETNEGKRKCESLWPIFKTAHQKSRYIFDLYHRRKEISKELYEFCLDQGYADRNLIAKWKKPGYERLCCLRCMQPRDHNFQTTCVCRVPKHLREEKVIECVHCGCRGCASGD
ncbi:hypothetical protein Nepgr_028184 [Nepenthes gracilis]|uniref:BTB domain-containing protein n=1 Tax=Nepenthes gracilis TaxID=150966 RepID=A0AAD3Y4A2_NEPGR|nr:hypothetical protein Nepgr_028184 [Nepenthes gracilis]